MLTDPAVPRRAIVRSLGAMVCLDSLLLVRFAFLPTFGSFEHLARCRNDLLIQRQFCVIGYSEQVVVLLWTGQLYTDRQVEALVL